MSDIPEMVERVIEALITADEHAIFVRRDKMRTGNQWEVVCFEAGTDSSQKIYARFATYEDAEADCISRTDERRAKAAIEAMRYRDGENEALFVRLAAAELLDPVGFICAYDSRIDAALGKDP